MALFEGKTPAERNKMIAAVALPLLALIFVVRMLFFGSSTPTRPTPNSNGRQNQNRNAAQGNQRPRGAPPEVVEMPTVVTFERPSIGGAGAGRNIFAYYVRPEGGAATSVKTEPTPPPPTPTPTPPLVLSNLSPPNIYAKTSSFTLQVSGDKFTPESRVYLDGQEMRTEFRGPQQLAAIVPAAALSAPGARSVIVRTPDNALYSNTGTLNVMQPPAPTYTYVGLIGRARNRETALLKNQKGELQSVQVNDLVETRFRVTAISQNAVDLVDKDLGIKHTLPYVEARVTGGVGPASRVPGSIQPPPPPPASDDDEEP